MPTPPTPDTGGIPQQEPPATGWQLPEARRLAPEDDGHDLVAVGADLEPGTLLAAYRSGLFPMHVHVAEGEASGRVPQLGWWSPDPRGVLPLDAIRVSRSLERSMRRFAWSVDQAFDEVLVGCADRGRSDGWINQDIVEAYRRLHELGWAHSVEVWLDDELVGGLYGVAIGGLFAGESMFHRSRDASKVALVHLVSALAADGSERLLDVQWLTPHLASLGAIEIPRQEYCDRLDQALDLPPSPCWIDGRGRA